MANSDVPPENNQNDGEIESPIDGPQPDWMKAATSGRESSFDENKAPDWLKSIRAGKSAGRQEEAPADQSEPAAQETSDDDGMSDLERLLAEEGIDLNTVSERRPTDAEGMSAKDWLISTSDDDLIRKRLDDTPMTETPAAASSPAPADDDRTMSDLERLLAEEGIDLNTVSEERPAEAEGMSAKDWLISTSDDDLIKKQLDDVLPPETPSPSASEPVSTAPAAEVNYEDDDKMVVSDDLPDWLRDIPDEEPAPTEAIPSAPEPAAFAEEDDDKMVVSDDLPDWLREVEDGYEDEAPPVPADTTPSAEAEDLPAWLREVEEEGSEEPAASELQPSIPPPDSMVDEDLPEWLSKAQEDESGEVTLPPDEASGEDLPDWLKQVQSKQEEAAASSAEPVAPPGAETPPSTPGEAEEGDEDLPDWLKEAQAEEESLAAVDMQEVSEISSTSMPIDEEELPDWLQETEVEETALFEPSEPSPDPFADVSLEEDETIAEEDLPDWLQEVQKETYEESREDTLTPFPIPEATPEPAIIPAAQDEDASAEAEALPDWLKEVEEGAEPLDLEEPAAPEPAAPSRPEPAVATPFDFGAAPVDEASDQVDEPEEPAPEPAVSPTMIEETIPAPSPADTAPTAGMPDWLKKLREGDEQEEPPSPQPAPVTPSPPQPTVRPASLIPQPAPQPPPPAAVPEPELPPEPTYEDLPGDAKERLKLAQSAGEKGDIGEAVRIYNSLVVNNAYLDTIIEHVQQVIKLYPSSTPLYQLMGDAMMRDGRLQSALEAYRMALSKL